MGSGVSTQGMEQFGTSTDPEVCQKEFKALVTIVEEEKTLERACNNILMKTQPADGDEGWVDFRDSLLRQCTRYKTIVDVHASFEGGMYPTTIEDLIKASGTTDLNLSAADIDDDEVPGLLHVFQIQPSSIVPEAVLDMKAALTSLTLKKNELTTIPDDFGSKMTGLVTLDLSENSISTLPESFGNLENLENLNLSENKLEGLPDSIGNLKNLKKLICFKNGIKRIPDTIAGCVSLEELNMFNNKLIKVPDSMADMSSLVMLNLGGNKLKTIPSTEKWTNLQKLSLAWNTVVMLRNFKGMTNLKQLQLNKNSISELQEDCFEGCNNLELLDLGTNRFETVPSSIENCVKLQQVSLQNNMITSLPDFSKCQDLKIINIGSNKLTSFSEGNFNRCECLETLLLNANQITNFDERMKEVTGLKRCNVSGNPWEEDPSIFSAMETICTSNRGRWIE